MRRQTLHRMVLLLLAASQWIIYASHKKYDLTIVGVLNWADGLGRIPIGLTEVLKDDLSINCICIEQFSDKSSVPLHLRPYLLKKDTTPGQVAFFTAPLWTGAATYADHVPHSCSIKIAYSMLESSKIPSRWVAILNKTFDLVVVPDEFYLAVYRNCGVKIPIYVVPHGVQIDHLLQQKGKQTASKPFTFGIVGTIDPRKNQDLLVEAFYREFGDNPHVRLRCQGRWAEQTYLAQIQKKIKQWRTQNVELIVKKFSDEECNIFLKSLDCYVLLSKGEGFSVTPREALALGNSLYTY